MASIAEQQEAVCRPPRRGAVFALTVDSTARPYDLSTLALGASAAPSSSGSERAEVVLYMQAETNDVFFHFHSATASDLSDTAAVSAGGAVAFATTYGAVLEAGAPPIKLRIDRKLDRWLIVKAANTSGILRFWAASDQS